MARAARVACPKSPPEMRITRRDRRRRDLRGQARGHAPELLDDEAPTLASRSVTVFEPDWNTDVCRSETAASKTRRNAGVLTAMSTALVTSGTNCCGTCADWMACSCTRCSMSDRMLGLSSSDVARALNWAEFPRTWPA